MHQIRSSLRYVNYRDRRRLAADLRPVYTAANADHAAVELERFDEQWGGRYPMIAQAWRRDWEHITPFLALPEDLRRVVYTTDENVKRSVAACGRFSGDGSVAAVVPRASDRLYRRRVGCRAPVRAGFGVGELSSRCDAVWRAGVSGR